MDTENSPSCDDVGTMTSDQSNLVVPMELENLTNFSSDIIMENKAETLENPVTAVTAYLRPRTTSHQGIKSSKRPNPIKKWIKVLLDTGSNQDLLFIKKGSKTYIPCCRRLTPQQWSTSAGTFKTRKVGKVDITFCDFDSHTAYCVDADVVEHTKRDPTPMYDLILGTRTLDKLGIILNF